jgi:hypothetical protein
MSTNGVYMGLMVMMGEYIMGPVSGYHNALYVTCVMLHTSWHQSALCDIVF